MTEVPTREKVAEFVCPECFGDDSLRARIQALQSEDGEDRCCIHPDQAGVPIRDVAEIVDPVFRQNYGIVSPDYNDREGDDLDFCVSELTQSDDEAVGRGLVKALIDIDPYWPPDGGEPFYDECMEYGKGDYTNSEHSTLWERFCREIVHEQRFFNSAAKDLLREIFEGVQHQQNEQGGKPLTVIQPGAEGSSFYRARIARDPEMRRRIAEDLALNLGPPPERLRRPGRMNPAGISAFYGAFDLPTCIAELRPAVADIIVGAKFEITEPIIVVDLTQFQKPQLRLGLFDKDQIRLTDQWQFMTRFMREISRPVSPQDEYLDYIPTQAVAEYLLHHFKFAYRGNETSVDAIIYHSAQYQGGKNIAILGDAARVGLLELDKSDDNRRQEEQSSARKFWDARYTKFRLAAKPATIETHVVVGANFSTEGYCETWSPNRGWDDDLPF